MTRKSFILTALFGIAIAIVIFRFVNTLAFYTPIFEYLYISPLAGFIMFLFMLGFITYLVYDKIKS